jgi:geranylgeranylglycerol-phosphate geranylgeranyltransferase
MIKSLLKLMRLYYVLPLTAGFVIIVSFLTAGHLHAIRFEILLAVLSLSCTIAAGYVLNDLCDIEVDRINNPQRVLPADRVDPKIALALTIFLFASALVFAALCNWRFLIAIALIAAGLVFYDLYSKRLGLFKAVTVAILTTSLYPLAFTFTASVDSPRLKSLYIFPAWLFLSCIAYEMLKDICDVAGDSRIFAHGIAAYSSRQWFLPAARTIAIIAGLLSIAPFALGYCKLIYLATSIIAIGLMILSTRKTPPIAIPFIYTQIFLITIGSFVDLLVFGP